MGLHLLLIDLPNLNGSLRNFYGRWAEGEERPKYDVLIEWMRRSLGPGDEFEACIFLNTKPQAGNQEAWLYYLKEAGFKIYAKPKIGDSDIDTEMLDHLHYRMKELPQVTMVAVLSGDARNFLEPLEDLADAGVLVYSLGFRESAGALAASPKIRFIDLEDEDLGGLFQEPIPGRIRLDSLPPEGAWL